MNRLTSRPWFFWLLMTLAVPSSLAQMKPDDDLMIYLSRTSTDKSHPTFVVHLKNVSDLDLLLNLGMMLGNGNKQYLDAIHFSLVNSTGKTLLLDLIGPAIIGGRIDPLVMPLPSGAEFAFPVDLSHYFAPKQNIWEIKLQAGRYLLNANYQGVTIKRGTTNSDMQGLFLFPVWTGHVTSQAVSFQFSK
jgi:hypothetical protein